METILIFSALFSMFVISILPLFIPWKWHWVVGSLVFFCMSEFALIYFLLSGELDSPGAMFLGVFFLLPVIIFTFCLGVRLAKYKVKQLFNGLIIGLFFVLGVPMLFSYIFSVLNDKSEYIQYIIYFGQIFKYKIFGILFFISIGVFVGRTKTLTQKYSKY